jgi:hypothetical protein
MAITKKELYQIARDRAYKEIKFKETIWDTLFINIMFFDITVLFLSVVISGFFPDIGGWCMGIAVGIIMISLIPIVISMAISERHTNAYSDKISKKAKEIFMGLKQEYGL